MMLVLLMIPSVFYASALENDIPTQDQQGVIYVGEGALVYGMSDISNAVIVSIQSQKPIQEIAKNKKKIVSVSEQVVKRENLAKQKARKIQQEVTARSIFHYLAKGNLGSIESSSSVHSGNLATAVTFSKIVGVTLSSPYVVHFFTVSSEKQKFFTSLSFIQFGKFRSSSLRAPPIFLI